MKVQCIIDSLGRGGTQTALVLLVQGLAVRGYSVRIIGLSDDADGLIVSRLRDAGAEVRVIGRSRLARGAGIYDVYREIRSWRPDVVQTMLPFADHIGRILGRLAGVPVVVSSIRARNLAKAWWQFLLDRMTARLADRIVFNSREVVSFALEREGVRLGQVEVIPNGVVVPDGPQCEAKKVRAALGIADNVPVVLSVGRLMEQKDHAALVHALADGHPILERTHAVIAGDGPLMVELVDLARRLGVSDRLHLPGLRDDVTELLFMADVYAHPAVFEGMPNAVMEAMACGCAVAACDIDGNRELIVHGENGLLSPAGDRAAFARSLTALLGDREAASRMGRKARESIQARYSPDSMTDGFTALYESLVAGRKS